MIRVEMKDKFRGEWRWHVTYADAVLSGRAEHPLFAACRSLRDIGVAPTEEIGLFEEGSRLWLIKTTVGYGAKVGKRGSADVRVSRAGAEGLREAR